VSHFYATVFPTTVTAQGVQDLVTDTSLFQLNAGHRWGGMTVNELNFLLLVFEVSLIFLSFRVQGPWGLEEGVIRSLPGSSPQFS
jgi:hypothetical protein